MVGFVLKTQYNTDKSGLGKKIDDADKKCLVLVDLLKKQIIKITVIEEKIPCITGLASTSALNAVGNIISNVRNLIKKTDYVAKLSQTL